MRRTVFFMILLFLLNALCLSAHAKTVGKFSKVEGRVDITRLGAPAILVHKGDEVGVGDIIRVKSKSKAEIIFGDGGILRIAQKSRVKIDEYIMEEERKKGIFNLFRGKIENVLKKTGGFFGFKKKNKHEVHTPTAVCGVRGTDFFSTYQKGISNFVFKEGQGYGYSKNRPDQVMNITTGQAMLVIKPDVLPIVRMATAEEIAQHSADIAIKEEDDRDEEKKKDEKVDEGSDDKKRDDKGKDKEPGDDEEKDQKPGGDEPEDQEPGDDKPRDREPDDQEPGDYEPGDEDRGDDKRGDRKKGDRRQSRYARAGDKPGDDRRGDDGPDDYGPRGDRRGDYGPRDGRAGDRDPGDYGPRDHRPGGPPPGDYRAGDYGPGDYGPKDYGPGGPPPSGDYGPWGPPPPGDYWGEGPPPPGDSGPWGPPPPGDYWGEGPPPPGDSGPWGPPPPGDYWGEGPPPPGDYWRKPGDFYAGDFGPGDYWGEGPPPPGDYWGKPGDFYAGDFGLDDNWGGPDDYWGRPDDYWGGPDDYWGGPINDYWGMGPDIMYDIYDYIPGFRVDNIGISGNSGTSKYDLSMSGIYNWTPPFVYMYEDIKGQLTGNLKAGYFLGFTACGWNTYGQTVDGIASFFYIDSGNATGGLLMGDVSGSYSIDPNNWNASGSLDWVKLGDNLSVPNSVQDIHDYARDIFFVSGSGDGDFYDASGDDVGDLIIYKSDGIFDSVQEGQHWGYWRSHIGGYYSTIEGKTPDDFYNWFSEWELKGIECDTSILNLRLYMSVHGDSSHYSYGEFEGDMAGGWVDIEHAVTGIIIGEFHGGYDPSGHSTDIFAASGGVWLDTSILMAKLGTETGRDDLAKLNIPNVEIGKATLSGSRMVGADQINVTMTDVTFLARTTGGTPRIWATDSVSGTYAGTPSTSWTVNLNQTSGTDATGVNAEFSLKTWDTSSNKWGATINNGSGTVGGAAITFKGGAGGNIDNPATGQIKGTAAGWAH